MNKWLTVIFSLSLARLSLRCFRSLFFLGGREELLASLRTWTVSSFCCILFLGTGLQTFLREGALGSGRLELYHEALGIVPRGARACASLLFTVFVFMGTVLWLFLGTGLLLFLGTACLGVTRDGWLGWGSCIQWRRLSCNGEVTSLNCVIILHLCLNCHPFPGRPTSLLLQMQSGTLLVLQKRRPSSHQQTEEQPMYWMVGHSYTVFHGNLVLHSMSYTRAVSVTSTRGITTQP